MAAGYIMVQPAYVFLLGRFDGILVILSGLPECIHVILPECLLLMASLSCLVNQGLGLLYRMMVLVGR